jgi:hypothetical protein
MRAMSRWFRVYDDLVDDPKVQRLSGDQFKSLLNLWCLASQGGGFLPCPEDIGFKLRLSVEETVNLLGDFKKRGLLDQVHSRLQPHNWNHRQFRSDVSTARVKRFRKRQRNVSETSPDTEYRSTETESERKKVSRAAPETNGQYFFAVDCIRLNERDYKKWERAFPHLDLRAELTGCAPWAAEQGSWFNAVSALLAKKEREAHEREVIRAKDNAPKREGPAW